MQGAVSFRACFATLAGVGTFSEPLELGVLLSLLAAGVAVAAAIGYLGRRRGKASPSPEPKRVGPLSSHTLGPAVSATAPRSVKLPPATVKPGAPRPFAASSLPKATRPAAVEPVPGVQAALGTEVVIPPPLKRPADLAATLAALKPAVPRTFVLAQRPGSAKPAAPKPVESPAPPLAAKPAKPAPQPAAAKTPAPKPATPAPPPPSVKPAAPAKSAPAASAAQTKPAAAGHTTFHTFDDLSSGPLAAPASPAPATGPHSVGAQHPEGLGTSVVPLQTAAPAKAKPAGAAAAPEAGPSSGAAPWEQGPRNPRAPRIVLGVPVLIQSDVGSRKSLREQTRTAAVLGGGAVVQLSARPELGEKLKLTNVNTGKELECKVVGIQRGTSGKTQVELEFLQPAPQFWPVSFPAEASAPAGAKRPQPPATSRSITAARKPSHLKR